MRKEFVLKSLTGLARPLVRLCLRHGVKLGELIDSLKRVYVESAEADLESRHETISVSRISLMTGVHRTDVAAIRTEGKFSPRERHTASNVITQWRCDPRFCAKRGAPRPLTCEGKQSEFAELVRSVSQSISPYTVSFELERLGMVKRLKDGRMKLTTRVFVPKNDPALILEMLGEDASDLYDSVDENAFFDGDGQPPHHHLKTEFTNVPNECLPKVRHWLWREGAAFHERARNFLSRFDRDTSPEDLKGTGTNRIAVASFSRVDVCRTRHTDQNHNEEKV
jgi:Family of unknown function (DUF6502)